MDVWNWVFAKEEELYDAGHERLAYLVDKMPEFSLENDHESVDLYAEEAIQLAKALKEPWVEIFIRHWRLQSKVLIRQEPKEMLREAVELLEFSHRTENINCPQSVCVVQDLASCYGAADGAGYSQERIDVCKETLARITPRWDCYVCVSVEFISALYDEGDFEGAQKKLEEVDDQRRLVGETDISCELECLRADVLIKLGQYDAAERALKRIDMSSESLIFQLELQVCTAVLCAHRGQFNEAMQALPSYDTIKQNASLHMDWMAVVSMCVRDTEEPVSKELLNIGMEMLLSAEARGTNREALNMGAIMAQIHGNAGNLEHAQQAIEVMKRVQPLLHKNLGAAELIADIDKRFACG